MANKLVTKHDKIYRKLITEHNKIGSFAKF